MGSAPCRDKANLKKGAWSREDTKLKEYIEEHDNGGNWIPLPQKADLKRCGKSYRKRWVNYLRPDINRGPFSEEEDNIICRLYSLIGSRWSTIAAQLQGRTDNDIKNHWTARLKKKLLGKSKDHQVDQLAVERPASNEVQSNFTSEAITSPNFYGPQQVQHIDINMDAPYSNLCTGIISQMFEQNCCSRVTESSSSKESVIFPLNPQQVQFDHELSDHNLCLRKVPQNLQGFGIDHHSNNNMIMINTGSPVQAFNCINFSQRQHLNADNQYSLDAANQTSYETSVLSPVLPYATHMDNYIKRGQPSAASVQNVNSQFFPSFPSPEEGNNESAWNMDTLCGEGYNFHEYLQCMNTLDGFNGSTVTESGSSSEADIFPLNPQQVQFDHELSDHNLCLRKLPQNLQGFGADHHSINNINMINTSSPVQASNSIDFSQIQHFNANNQYTSDAAIKTSYETSSSPVLPYATYMDNYIKQEQPYAASVQNVNSQFFPSSPSPEEGNNERRGIWIPYVAKDTTSMNTLDAFNGSTVTESGSSSEAAIFPLNPQQVQFDEELCDHNLCLRKLSQSLQGVGADHHSIKNINMINTSSPVQASNCINFSQIQHVNANNQYSSDAAIQASYETSVSPVLPYIRHMHNYIKQEQPSAASVQNVNSQVFSCIPLTRGGTRL